MAYLGSNETRWGQLRRELPDSFNKISEIINTLHIAYSYMGNYPKDNAKEEYKNWRKSILESGRAPDPFPNDRTLPSNPNDGS